METATNGHHRRNHWLGRKFGERMAHRLVARSALVALFASIGAFGASSVSSSAPSPEPAEETICNELDIYLLIDVSLSLRQTDPRNERIIGARAFVSGLTGVNGTLTISGFGTNVDADPPEFVLPDQIDDALKNIDAFTSRNDDWNTDYVNAILGAHKHFEGRGGRSNECNRFVWFTDGAYDIERPSDSDLGYTLYRSRQQINESLMSSICGPLEDHHDGGTLTEPVAQLIRGLDIDVRLVDLDDTRVSGSASRWRALTEPTLTRMLGGDDDDDCRVRGSRIEVAEASQLTAEFFLEAQQQSGRQEFECSAFDNGGIPASIVRDIALLAGSGAETTVLIGGEPVEQQARTSTYAPTDSDRLRGVEISHETTGGSLERCFGRFDGVIERTDSEPIWDQASSPEVSFAVGHSNVQTRPSSGVGDQWVDLQAVVDGASATIRWDALGRWNVQLGSLEGREELTVEVTGSIRIPDLEPIGLTSISETVRVSTAPPVPQLLWDIDDSLIIETGERDTQIDVPPVSGTLGEFCVTFNRESFSLKGSDGGGALGVLNIPEQDLCFDASEGGSIHATLDIEQVRNTTAEVESIAYTSVFTPEGEESLTPGSGSVTTPDLTFARPISGNTRLFLVLLLTAVSALMTYLVLQFFNVLQARLRNPTEVLSYETFAEYDPTSSAPARSGVDLIRVDDLKQVTGSRSRYDIKPDLHLQRKLSLNPLKDLTAMVSSDDGPVVAHPSNGAARRSGRWYPTPLSFHHLVIARRMGDRLQITTLMPGRQNPREVPGMIDSALVKMNPQIAAMFAEPEEDATPETVSEDQGPSAPGRPSAPRSAPQSPPTPGAPPSSADRPRSDGTPAGQPRPVASPPPRPKAPPSSSGPSSNPRSGSSQRPTSRDRKSPPPGRG